MNAPINDSDPFETGVTGALRLTTDHAAAELPALPGRRGFLAALGMTAYLVHITIAPHVGSPRNRSGRLRSDG